MKNVFGFYIPSGIDLEALKAAHPVTHIPHYKDEKLLYVLHIMTTIPASNKDISYESGYIPINANILRSVIGKEYHYYLEYLVDTGVLSCNYSFSIRFNRSTGYKFKPTYQTELRQVTMPISKPLFIHLECDYLDESAVVKTVSIDGIEYVLSTEDTQPVISLDKLPCKAKELNQEEMKVFNALMRRNYPFAYKWLDEGGLQIDHESAHSYNAAIWKYKKDT